MQVLIIDDHSAWCEGLIALLKPQFSDFEFSYISSASAALELLSKENAAFDIVLMDEHMPEMSGSVLHRKLLENDINVKTIFLSGFLDDYHLYGLVKAGITGFIPKNYTADQIADAIKYCCDVGLYLPEGLHDRVNELQKIFYKQEAEIIDRNITRREFEVLAMMEKRFNNQHIADCLARSVATVKTHINRLYSKFSDGDGKVSNRQQCIDKAFESGVLIYGLTNYEPACFDQGTPSFNYREGNLKSDPPQPMAKST